VSLGQLKVMAAIESCRTAALGGHVERCEDCAHAAKQWLAEREAELLPLWPEFRSPGAVESHQSH
jgi:Transposase zinc-binding domain